MAWINEAPYTFTPVGSLFFSPIVTVDGNKVVFVSDQRDEFWKYNLDTQAWTQLATPNYWGFYHCNLVPDDMENPTALYTVRDWDISYPPYEPTGDGFRISKYTIATNTWTDSARVPPFDVRMNPDSVAGFQVGEIVQGDSSGATAFIRVVGGDWLAVVPQTATAFQQAEGITGLTSGATATLDGAGHSFGTSPYWVYEVDQNLRSIVYVDATHIYAFAARTYYHSSGSYSYPNVRCICYNPTADTWEVFSENYWDEGASSLYYRYHRSAAINAAGTVIYSGECHQNGYYLKYTLATDTYSQVNPGNYGEFGFAHDKDKLWYVSGDRHGYLDTADDSVNEDQFPENPVEDTGELYFGITDDILRIIAHALTTTPWIMSCEVIVAPTIVGGLNPAIVELVAGVV